MTDFLLELLSEEVPARMQARARNDLARMFAEQLSGAGLSHEGIVTYSTPRRLALIARGLPLATEAVSEELKGPRTSAPPQALEGFLRKTGLSQDQLEDRDGVYFAKVDKPGRATSEVLAETVANIVRDFPWPKSMRWGDASASTASLRWVRPLHSIVALLGEEIVPVEIDGVDCGAATLGHRFHHPGQITIGGAHDYVEKLRACHVIVDQEEREAIIRKGAIDAAEHAGLLLVEDEGLVVENAGLTEWPVPLFGSFDPDFLDVPEEVIALTARTNQKYFVMRSAAGKLSPHFVCVANISANDDGLAIVAGNERVLAARLSDARFFWQQDLKVPLEEQAKKLEQIVFHEKLGTVADKVERVAKLARWLVEEGIVSSSPERGGGARSATEGAANAENPLHQPSPSATAGPPPRAGEDLAWLAERAARLAKADLVTGMVGEFPELQGIIGGHLARAQGEPDTVADAIRDHYKPVGPGDEVPTAPVTVAVSLADKLDSLVSFFLGSMAPTGSKDPYALRRAGLAFEALIIENCISISLNKLVRHAIEVVLDQCEEAIDYSDLGPGEGGFSGEPWKTLALNVAQDDGSLKPVDVKGPVMVFWRRHFARQASNLGLPDLFAFFIDRLKVQRREAGVRHDLIDAVFALGGEDDLVRLLSRVEALQQFVAMPEGADLLAGYKRAANILKKENWSGGGVMATLKSQGIAQTGEEDPLAMVEEPVVAEAVAELADRKAHPAGDLAAEERALIDTLDVAEPMASVAIANEDFTAAMSALASLRAPIDAFFDKVTVNDPDADIRARRLNLLLRFRDAVGRVADFSKIEG